MAREFVVATVNLSEEEEAALANTFAGKGWWHWIPNFWIVIDPTDQLTPSSIRDSIRTITNGQKVALVLEIEGKTWAAMTRKDPDGKDNAAAWLYAQYPP